MKIILTLLMSVYLAGCASIVQQPELTLSESYLQGKEAYHKKDYKHARSLLEPIIKKHPYNNEALFLLANISMHQRDWSQAMHYYTAVLDVKPTHPKAHHNLAMLHLLQARKHINYYVANNQYIDNQGLNELIISIDNYSKPKRTADYELDKLADHLGLN